jgi:hypothetical protein
MIHIRRAVLILSATIRPFLGCVYTNEKKITEAPANSKEIES